MTRPPFGRVLVANRGEIALRIIRACQELGMEAVAVFSDADRDALHVRHADAAIHIGPAPPAESYLRIDAIVHAARETRADAVHPGYGFLAERAAFAAAVESAGLAFVGPPSEVIARLGDKLAARRLAVEAGVAVVPGTVHPAEVDAREVEALIREAEAIGYPLLVKAAAGGGGRGMRRVERPAELPAALMSGSEEARSAFGDGAVYLERELVGARHVEVQLLGDADGNVVALGERDCSLQRRHQKLVEEAPAPGLTGDQRRALHASAVRLAGIAGLRNAATAEFLLTPDGAFHFLEVNTRLQVEHGVTELVTGVDLVHEQLWIAAGRPLSGGVLAAASAASAPSRHALEVRITAEDPAADFVPTPGRIRRWSMPGGPGVRVDSGAEAGALVSPHYDNLVAKLMVVAGTRDAAIDRLGRALGEAEIAGIQTTLPFHRFVASAAAFRDPRQLSTEWVAAHWDGPRERAGVVALGAVAAGLGAIEPMPLGHEGAGTEGGAGAVQVPSVAPGGPSAGSGRSGDASGWRAAARAEAIRSWPPAPPAWRQPVPLPAEPAGFEVPRGPVGERLRVQVAPSPGETEPSSLVVVPPGGDRGNAWTVDEGSIEYRPERLGLERAILHASGRPSRALVLPARDRPGSLGARGLAGPDGAAFEVIVNGWRLLVDVELATRAELRARARRGGGAAGSVPPAEVRAIIPGRVAAVLVGPGDAISAGQGLLVVEAMKMQNELRAPRAGTIARVAVTAGQTVEAGGLLVVIE